MYNKLQHYLIAHACIWIFLESVDKSPKALNYRLYKKGVSLENYLEILKDNDLFLLCRFRTSNHRLPIEIGRW